MRAFGRWLFTRRFPFFPPFSGVFVNCSDLSQRRKAERKGAKGFHFQLEDRGGAVCQPTFQDRRAKGRQLHFQASPTKSARSPTCVGGTLSTSLSGPLPHLVR